MKLLGDEPVYDLYTKVMDVGRSEGAAKVDIWRTLRPTLYVWVIDNRLTDMRHWGKI